MLIPVPIVQGGMGVGVSLSGLAAAVANEGGIGVVISSAGLGLLYAKLSSDFLEASILGLKEEMRKVKEKTKGIIGVNIMVAMSNFEDMVKTAIAEKVDIIFSGAGLPLNLPKFQTPDSVTKLAPIVSSGKAARLICEKWKLAYNYLPDAIVVEGPKAGGHLGFKKDQIDDPNYALEKLIPQVVNEVRVFEEKYDCKNSGNCRGWSLYRLRHVRNDAMRRQRRTIRYPFCYGPTNVMPPRDSNRPILMPAKMKLKLFKVR